MRLESDCDSDLCYFFQSSFVSNELNSAPIKQSQQIVAKAFLRRRTGLLLIQTLIFIVCFV